MAHDSKRLKADLANTSEQTQEKDSSGEEQVPLLPHEKLSSNTNATQPPARRKFAPQPIATSTHSTRMQKDGGKTMDPNTATEDVERPSLTRHRFPVELVETTAESNRNDVSGPEVAIAKETPVVEAPRPSSSSSRRKFPVQVIESSSRSNRSSQPTSQQRSPERPKPHTPPRRRKFEVQMIETASRSRRAGDSSPAVRAEDKTNGTHSESFKVPRPPPTPLQPPNNTPLASTQSVPLAQLLKPNPNRQGSMHAHYTTRANTRQHSFKVPDLEAIDSSESSPTDADSRHSPSSSISSDDEGYKDATRLRESVDDRFSGYLLALAARAAEKQLREQELAVFPAPDAHEPIAHYVDSEGSSEESVEPIRPAKTRYRRDSEEEEAAVQAMRRRGEEQYKKSQAETIRKPTGGFNVEFDADAAQEAWIGNKPQTTQNPKPNKLIGGYQRDPDLKQMRKAASPPMLGGDIDFPRCPSPDHARFDVTQGNEFLRTNMSYLDGQGNNEKQGLWARADHEPSVVSSAGSKSPGAPPGLWGGHCTSSDPKTGSAPNGIVTPARTPVIDKEDPFAMFSAGAATGASVAGKRRPPPTPPPSNSGASNTSVMSLTPTKEDSILEREFPDSFVTQVYNYLSLGFPALARKFDPELSKISGVDVEELRRDDKLAEQRGYLRLGEHEVDVPAKAVNMPGKTTAKGAHGSEDEATEEDDFVPVQEEMCARWRALRIYVREWGRQMGVADEGGEKKRLDPHGAWGMPARKGSWAG